jgi:hypothetical protein
MPRDRLRTASVRYLAAVDERHEAMVRVPSSA